MVSLHLRAPPGADVGNEEDARRRKKWLESIEAVLLRVLSGEARMWLITALSSLEVPAHIQVDCFLDLLQNSMRDAKSHGEDGHGAFELQFMRILCENRPRLVAKLVAEDSGILKRLFSGQPKRILQWFGHFAGAGQSEHEQGARALANYAFRNRDVCWHLLSWEGKHAQAPATVAAKPHYFLELDVVDTVLNFLEDEPEFWGSDELRDSLKDGEFLSIDVAFFSQELVKKMVADKDHSTNIWRVMKDYVKEESFSVLCQQLLHVASDDRLLKFLNDLGSDLSHNHKRSRDQEPQKNQREMVKLNGNTKHKSWIEIVAFAGVKWKCLEEAMLCNACTSHGRNLWRILQEEEHEEDASTLKQLMTERFDNDGRGHWALRHEVLTMRKTLAFRYLALEGWVLFYWLWVESIEIAAIEALLVESDINYRRCSSTSEDVEVNRKNKKRKSGKHVRRKKHRRRETSDSEGENEAARSDIEDADTKISSSNLCSWRLSIDDYSLTWTKADLAEYLMGYAVQEWLKWFCEGWR